MKDRHILEILDETGFAELKGDALESVRAHCAGCANCRQAFEAARISAVLLHARLEIAPVEPSVFFQSKVLNAIREKQQFRNPIVAFRRWWQASYALVCSMMFFVITLALLTILAPKPESAQAANGYLYTTDSVILNQNPPQNITTEQALEVIYTERRSGGNPVKR